MLLCEKQSEASKGRPPRCALVLHAFRNGLRWGSCGRLPFFCALLFPEKREKDARLRGEGVRGRGLRVSLFFPLFLCEATGRPTRVVAAVRGTSPGDACWATAAVSLLCVGNAAGCRATRSHRRRCGLACDAPASLCPAARGCGMNGKGGGNSSVGRTGSRHVRCCAEDCVKRVGEKSRELPESGPRLTFPCQRLMAAIAEGLAVKRLKSSRVRPSLKYAHMRAPLLTDGRAQGWSLPVGERVTIQLATMAKAVSLCLAVLAVLAAAAVTGATATK